MGHRPYNAPSPPLTLKSRILSKRGLLQGTLRTRPWPRSVLLGTCLVLSSQCWMDGRSPWAEAAWPRPRQSRLLGNTLSFHLSHNQQRWVPGPRPQAGERWETRPPKGCQLSPSPERTRVLPSQYAGRVIPTHVFNVSLSVPRWKGEAYIFRRDQRAWLF